MTQSLKIVLTGGPTGGHIYPLIAVADAIKKNTAGKAEIFYVGAKGFLAEEFKKREIKTYYLLSSKLRRYFDLENIIDIPKFFISFFQALCRLYFLMPDVVFSKGGGGATLAVVLASRFYFIPVVIHESDARPGLVSRLSGRLAKRIGISFLKAAGYFPAQKIFFSGNPVREEILNNRLETGLAKERLGFDKNKSLLLVLGGSQGAKRINDFVFDNLEKILNLSQVYHQVGAANLEESGILARSILKNFSPANGYKLAGYLNAQEMGLVLSAADVVLSRAGAGLIYEIAAFKKPAILVPLDESANDHQRANAYEYAKAAGAVVIEENNFTINIFLVQLKNLLQDKANLKFIENSAEKFFKPDATAVLANETLKAAQKQN